MTTWFVASAGSNSNNGTSSGTPFQTIAHAMGVVAANDTVLLNRGDRFGETVTIPQPGVTLDAYGAAATFDSDGYGTNAPVIDGGTTIAGGWTSYVSGVNPLLVQDSFTGSSGTALSSHPPNVGGTWSKQIGASIVLDGTGGCFCGTTSTTVYYATAETSYLNPTYSAQCVVTFETIVASDIAGPVVHAAAGTAQTYYSAVMNSNGQIAIQRNGNGQSSGTGFVASGFTPIAGNSFTIEITVVGLVVTMFINGTQALQFTDPTPLFGAALIDPGLPGILIHPGSSGETATTGVHISAFSAGPLDTGTASNTYQVAMAALPTVVDFNGTYVFAGIGPNTLATNQWYWYHGTLYFCTGGAAPAAGSVVAGQHSNGIFASGQSGLTIQNVAVEHTNFEAYSLTNTPGLTLQNCYAQRTSVVSGGAHNSLVLIEGTQTNSVVQRNVFRQFGAAGVGGVSTTGPYTIQFNKFFDVFERFGQDTIMGNTSDTTAKVFRGNVTTFPAGQVGVFSNSEKGSAVLFGDNWLVERNLTINCPLFGTTHPGNNHVVRYNFHYRAGGGFVYSALGLNGGGGAMRVADNSATVYTGHQFYGNAMLDCVCGIWVDSASTASRTNFSYYNNLIININVVPGVTSEVGSAAGTCQVFFNQAMSGVFENNVIYNAQGSGTGGMFFVNETALNAWATDHNLWTPDAAGCFSFKGTAYNTLAAYQAGASRDAHSINSTPTFSNQSYQPPARPGLNEIYTALNAFRNYWRSPARHLGVVVAGVTQMPSPDAGIEATNGYWGVAA